MFENQIEEEKNHRRGCTQEQLFSSLTTLTRMSLDLHHKFTLKMNAVYNPSCTEQQRVEAMNSLLYDTVLWHSEYRGFMFDVFWYVYRNEQGTFCDDKVQERALECGVVLQQQ